MSHPVRLSDYLDKNGVNYQTIAHPASMSSTASAVSAKVPLHQLAKAIVLEDHQGKKLVAILPADYKISLLWLNECFKATFRLLSEEEVSPLFNDCEFGAVPANGDAYYINSVYEDSLTRESDIYLEAGDHKTLFHLSRTEFAKLTDRNHYSHFARQA